MSSVISIPIEEAIIYDSLGLVGENNTFSFSAVTYNSDTEKFDEATIVVSGTPADGAWVPNASAAKKEVNVVIGGKFNRNHSNSSYNDKDLIYYDVTVSGVSSHAVQNEGNTFIVGGTYSDIVLSGSTGTGGAAFRSRSSVSQKVDGKNMTINSEIADVFAIVEKVEIVNGEEKKNGTLITGNTSANGMGGAIHTFGVDTKWYISGATFSQNVAEVVSAVESFGGGAIAQQQAQYLLIQNSFFYDNYAANVGGAITLIYSPSTAANTTAVYNTTFSGNTAAVKGGAINVYQGDLISKDNSYRENKSVAGGALYINKNSNEVTITEDNFIDNIASEEGGAIYASKAISITGAAFTGNTAAGGAGGAIYVNAKITIENSEFNYNRSHQYGGAVYFNSGNGSEITNCTFTGNTAYDDRGGAMALGSSAIVTVKNSTFTGNVGERKNCGAIRSNGVLTVENCTFIDNESKGSRGGTFGNAGALSIDSSSTTVTNSYFKGNIAKLNGGAIYTAAGATVNISGSTFATASDTIYSLGTVNFSGNITLNANLGGTGTFNTAGANFTIGKDVDLNGVNFSNASITVDGADYLTNTLVATGVGGVNADKLYVTNNDFLTLTLDGTELWLKEIAGTTITEDKFTGNGTTNMGGGEVGTLFATKGEEKEITTKISGGKVAGNLVGGAYVAAGKTAAVDNAELIISGTAEFAEGSKAYVGGYLYGNKADAEAAATAQLTVGNVDINILGGTVNGNMFGGAHAREKGNAQVDTVNITVTDGDHSRIYAGGWAEKGAVSSVGTANVTISGGSVDYLYGAGANADGKTYVTTSNITISGDAVVNTIYMGGRYGYSYVDTVNLTFAGENKALTRLSGVSSAGMDYAQDTIVELETNVSADLIDYVDKFVINENCLLTTNNEFYLGGRNNETGATEDFTTFDFIADGEASWTAVAGISDFTNAKFSVNGAGLTTWDGKAALAIGDYTLTYDANKKTITLANA